MSLLQIFTLSLSLSLSLSSDIYFHRKKEIKKAERMGNVYIEVNPNAVLVAENYKKAFPQLDLIFITRDFPEYFLSAWNKSPSGDGRSFFYAENDSRKRVTAQDFPNDPCSKHWPQFDRANRIAWWWCYANERILRAKVKYPDASLLKFEKLYSNKSEAFEEWSSLLKKCRCADPGTVGNILENIECRVDSTRDSVADGESRLPDFQDLVERRIESVQSKLGYV